MHKAIFQIKFCEYLISFRFIPASRFSFCLYLFIANDLSKFNIVGAGNLLAINDVYIFPFGIWVDGARPDEVA